jgi:hypothetical protein
MNDMDKNEMFSRAIDAIKNFRYCLIILILNCDL